jgi:preprotein translocase subunit SecE
MFRKLKTFIAEVRVELSKATWPWDPKENGFRRYKELADSTVVVIVAMVIVGGYIAFFDLMLVNVVGWLTRV